VGAKTWGEDGGVKAASELRAKGAKERERMKPLLRGNTDLLGVDTFNEHLGERGELHGANATAE
jgi:hypothetical protein